MPTQYPLLPPSHAIVQTSANQLRVRLRTFGLTPVVLVGHVGIAQAAFALGLIDEPACLKASLQAASAVRLSSLESLDKSGNLVAPSSVATCTSMHRVKAIVPWLSLLQAASADAFSSETSDERSGTPVEIPSEAAGSGRVAIAFRRGCCGCRPPADAGATLPDATVRLPASCSFAGASAILGRSYSKEAITTTARMNPMPIFFQFVGFLGRCSLRLEVSKNSPIAVNATTTTQIPTN